MAVAHEQSGHRVGIAGFEPVVLRGDIRYFDAYIPSESISSLLNLDVETQVEAGRTTLVLDAEGTFVQYDGWKVDAPYSEWFAGLRDRGFERVIITTNKKPKDEADLVQMQAWVEQAGADLLISPMDRSQRKPSPYMLFAAMQEFDIEPQSMVYVGDKLSQDVLAANLAHVHSVHLTNRYGNADHPGDRYFKRPAERHILQRLTRGRVTGVYDREETVDSQSEADALPSPDLIVDDYIAEMGRLAGYGARPIVLSPEYRAKLPPPQLATLRQVLGTTVELFTQLRPVAAYNEYLKQHGEDHAEWLTARRKQSAHIVGGLAAVGGRNATVAAVLLNLGQHISDGLDGMSIRKSGADLKSERRKRGANADREADQAVSLWLGIGAVVGGIKDPVNQTLQTLRGPLRNRQVRKFSEQGHDTKADPYSKFANELLGVVDLTTLVAGRNAATISLQSLATVLKYDSMRYSERHVWPYRRARLEAAEMVLAQLKSRQ